MGNTTKQKQGIIIVLLAGIIMGMAFSGRYMSKSWNFDAFYDVGNVYDEYTFWFYQGEGIVYKREKKKVEVQGGEASQYWILPLNLKDYNSFIFELEELSSSNTDVLFQLYSGETLVKEIPIQLENGKNIVEVSDITANIMYMRLYQKQGLSYEVKSVQYRENITEWDNRTFWLISLLGFLGCVVVLLLIRWILWKRNIYFSIVVFIDKLQKVFLKISGAMGERALSKKSVSFWRVALFFFLISFMNYGERAGVSRQELSRNIKIFCGVLLIIAVLSVEKKITLQKWEHPLAISWFWLIACMSISFLIVPKRVDIGIINLLIFGFFFFVWGNMERPQEMLCNLCTAIKWEFWLGMIYSCLFFPEQTGYVYRGVYRNPNIFAIYILVPYCVFLAEMVSGKKDIFVSKSVSALGLGISICMIWKSQCRSVLGGIALSILVSCYTLFRRKSLEKKGIDLLRRFGLMIIIVAGLFVGHIGINSFPLQENSVNMTDSSSLDKRGNIFVLNVEAGQFPNNKFIQKIVTSKSLDEFMSGRIGFWKAYLRQMNFWGHEFRAVVNGKRYLPHNGFLYIAYQYGVLCVIPYLFFIIYYIIYGYKYYKINREMKRYAGFPLLLIISIFPFLLLDNLESPFQYEAWLVMYLTTGLLLENREIVPNKEEWLNAEETAIVESGQDGLKR